MPQKFKSRVFDPHITVYFSQGIQLQDGKPVAQPPPYAMEHHFAAVALMCADVELHVHHCHCCTHAPHSFVSLLYIR